MEHYRAEGSDPFELKSQFLPQSHQTAEAQAKALAQSYIKYMQRYLQEKDNAPLSLQEHMNHLKENESITFLTQAHNTLMGRVDRLGEPTQWYCFDSWYGELFIGCGDDIKAHALEYLTRLETPVTVQKIEAKPSPVAVAVAAAAPVTESPVRLARRRPPPQVSSFRLRIFSMCTDQDREELTSSDFSYKICDITTFGSLRDMISKKYRGYYIQIFSGDQLVDETQNLNGNFYVVATHPSVLEYRAHQEQARQAEQRAAALQPTAVFAAAAAPVPQEGLYPAPLQLAATPAPSAQPLYPAAERETAPLQTAGFFATADTGRLNEMRVHSDRLRRGLQVIKDTFSLSDQAQTSFNVPH